MNFLCNHRNKKISVSSQSTLGLLPNDGTIECVFKRHFNTFKKNNNQTYSVKQEIVTYMILNVQK